MNNIKKHYIFAVVILVVLVAGFLSILKSNRHNYSLADFGVQPLLKADCSSVKNTDAPYSVSTSFNVPNVSAMRDKAKALITKYGGHIASDSFNSSPGSTLDTSSDYASITVTFDKSQNEFLTELSAAVKNSEGVDTSYDYTDGSGYSSNSSYSPYTSCVNNMQSVSADVLQLEVLTKALREERDSANISFLSQSIVSAKSTLQNDVDNMNNFFATSDKPSVNISISSL